MNKNIVSLILILVGVFAAFKMCKNSDGIENKYNKQNWKTQDLLGEVQLITEETFDAVDKFGNLEKGNLKSSHLYFYSKSGNLEKEITTFINEGDTTKLSFTYQYDNKDLLITCEVKNLKTGKLDSKTNYLYEEGNRIEEVLYDGESGELSSKSIFSEFENHRPKSQKYYGGGISKQCITPILDK